MKNENHLSELEFLGGQYFPEAYSLMLNSLSLAFNFADEKYIDEAKAKAEAMAVGTSRFLSLHGKSADGVRLWWRGQFETGENYWISVEPGEFTTTPPPEPCMIVDLPAEPPQYRWRDLLESALISCEGFGAPLPSDSSAQRIALDLLNRSDTEAKRSELYLKLRTTSFSERNDLQKFVNQIYEDYLFGKAVTLMEFADLELMFQLQNLLNLRVEQEWEEDTLSFVGGLIVKVVSDEGNLDMLVRHSGELFDLGREELTSGLDGSMDGLHRKLILAAHYYSQALALSQFLNRTDIKASKLGLSPIVVEEAWVCLWTGVQSFAKMSFESLSAWPLEYVMNAGGIKEKIKEKVFLDASEIHPQFTRKFAEIMYAYALTELEDAADVDKGLIALKSLHEEVAAKGWMFEMACCENGILNAHKRLENDDEAWAMASRIAGRALIQMKLAKGEIDLDGIFERILGED